MTEEKTKKTFLEETSRWECWLYLRAFKTTRRFFSVKGQFPSNEQINLICVLLLFKILSFISHTRVSPFSEVFHCPYIAFGTKACFIRVLLIQLQYSLIDDWETITHSGKGTFIFQEIRMVGDRKKHMKTLVFTWAKKNGSVGHKCLRIGFKTWMYFWKPTCNWNGVTKGR